MLGWSTEGNIFFCFFLGLCFGDDYPSAFIPLLFLSYFVDYYIDNPMLRIYYYAFTLGATISAVLHAVVRWMELRKKEGEKQC